MQHRDAPGSLFRASPSLPSKEMYDYKTKVEGHKTMNGHRYTVNYSGTAFCSNAAHFQCINTGNAAGESLASVDRADSIRSHMNDEK